MNENSAVISTRPVGFVDASVSHRFWLGLPVRHQVGRRTIAPMSRTCGGRLQYLVTAVRDLVTGAPVKYMDETGFRIGGQT